MASVTSMILWLVLAILFKAAHFFISALVVYKKNKKDVKVKYAVVQPGLKVNSENSKGTRKKLVLLGGQGFLGRHVVDYVQERFSDLFDVHVLDLKAQPNSQHPNVTYITGDIRIPSHLNSVLSGASAVIHMAESSDKANTDLGLMEDINVQGTKNVVEACIGADVKALVFKSTVLVHYSKDGSNSLLDVSESTVPPPETSIATAYAKSKRAAERLVIAVNSHVIRTCVLRTGIMYGVGDKCIVDPVLAGARIASNTVASSARPPYVWVHDAARAYVAAVVRLLFPDDDKLAQMVAQPWTGHVSPLDQSSSSSSSLANTNQHAAEPGRGKVGGQTLHIVAGQSTGFMPTHSDVLCLAGMRKAAADAWHRRPRVALPAGLAVPLARLNTWAGRRVGVCLLGSSFTVTSVRVACIDSGFQCTQAAALLGFNTAPFTESVSVMTAQHRSLENKRQFSAHGSYKKQD